MLLKDFVSPRKEVSFGGGSLTVRGLSIHDVMGLVTRHKEAAAEAFNSYVQGGDLGKGLKQFPELASEIIALACSDVGEDVSELSKVAAQLPLPVQVEVLVAAADLTFGGEEGLKKTLEMVTKLANQMADEIQSISTTGSAS